MNGTWSVASGSIGRRCQSCCQTERTYLTCAGLFAEDIDHLCAVHEDAIDDEHGAKIVSEFTAHAGICLDFRLVQK